MIMQLTTLTRPTVSSVGLTACFTAKTRTVSNIGQDNCGDNSDDIECFVCNNKKIIRAALRNNEIYECGDMSDERTMEVS